MTIPAKSDVSALLRSAAVASIRFTVDGTTIMRYGYGYVADRIDDSTIGLGLAQNAVYDAEYDHSSASAKPKIGFRSTFAWNANGMATIVHEATHAVIDAVRKGRDMDFLDGELTAYVAQTIFSINKGLPFNKTGPVATPLFNIASAAIKSAGPTPFVVDLSSSDAVAIKGYSKMLYGAVAAAVKGTMPQKFTPLGI